MKKLIALTLAVLFALSSLSAFAEVYKDKPTVKAVQQALNDAGYNCGKPDGSAGKKTKAAIESYQADKGLEVTGQIDDALLEALGLATETVESAASEDVSSADGNDSKEGGLSAEDIKKLYEPLYFAGVLNGLFEGRMVERAQALEKAGISKEQVLSHYNLQYDWGKSGVGIDDESYAFANQVSVLRYVGVVEKNDRFSEIRFFDLMFNMDEGDIPGLDSAGYDFLDCFLWLTIYACGGNGDDYNSVDLLSKLDMDEETGFFRMDKLKHESEYGPEYLVYQGDSFYVSYSEYTSGFHFRVVIGNFGEQ